MKNVLFNQTFTHQLDKKYRNSDIDVLFRAALLPLSDVLHQSTDLEMKLTGDLGSMLNDGASIKKMFLKCYWFSVDSVGFHKKGMANEDIKCVLKMNADSHSRYWQHPNQP